jgi:hypothetical protein
MAQYKFTAALNADHVPFISRLQGREVVISGMDNLLNKPGANSASAFDNNPKNLPQVIYMENVMPVEDGLMTAGQLQVQTAVGGGFVEFDEVFILRNATEQLWYFSPARGKNYVTPAPGTAWTSYNSTYPTSAEVSIAYVKGKTYVLYGKTKLFYWDGGIPNMVDVTASLVGLAIGNITSICGYGNYLIAATDVGYYWSSLGNELDFSDIVGGAGTQIPFDVRGQIKALTPTAGGVLIHCTQITVAALYTQNAQAPWIFRAVKNGGGIANRGVVTTDSTENVVYQYGTNGFQAVGLREAENLFPALTDFLDGRMIETADITIGLLGITRYTESFATKVAFVAGRYIVISYGPVAGNFNFAAIYDKDLRRWGKIKFDHCDCFSGFIGPKQSIFFLRNTGAAYQLVMDLSNRTTDSGMIILGKYQLSRTSWIQTQELVLETIDAADNPTVAILPSYDGTTFAPAVVMTANGNVENYRYYNKVVEAQNVSFAIIGNFMLASALMTFTKGGRM